MEVKQYGERNENELEEMWDEIAAELAKPKSIRKSNVDIYSKYGIPEATFYWRTKKPNFTERVVEICLNEAKLWIPELVEALKEKAINDKSEKSIEMGLKYIADVKDRLDVTTKDKEITALTDEQKKRIAQEVLQE